MAMTNQSRRKTFGSYVPPEDGVEVEQPRVSHVCKIHGCQMAGSIDGLCCYHWMAHPSEWPAVSEALNAEVDLLIEINTARRLFTNPTADYAEVHCGHEKAIARLAGKLTLEQIDFLKERKDTDYHTFIYSLEMLVGRAVNRVMHKRRDTEPRRSQARQPRSPVDLIHEMYPS